MSLFKKAYNLIMASVSDNGVHSNVHSVYFKVTGTTYKNDDGLSRQYILEHLFISFRKNDEHARITDVNYEVYSFQGRPAVRIYCNNSCIGNIPKDDVNSFLSIYNRDLIVNNSIDIKRILHEDGSVYYNPWLYVDYLKD